MSRLTIRDLENLSGIKAHTIRIWEQRYDFLKPRRSDTNIRYYCTAELKLVLDVALLNKAGYRISQINSLSVEQIREKAAAIPDKDFAIENKVNEVIGAIVDLDMDAFEKLIAVYTDANGIDQTVTKLLLPLLEKSGMLWSTGHLNTASEHLASHIIRQKLIVAIESFVARESNGKTILLFLPENDHKETGLLFMYYLVRKHGYQTIYLGDNVPFDDLVHIVQEKKPDKIFTHIIVSEPAFRTDRFVQQIHQKLPGVSVVISGKPVHYPRTLPANIVWKSSVEDVMEDLKAGVL